MQDKDDQGAKRAEDASPGAALQASEPLVSVIIPVRDDPDRIQQTLTCLVRQTLPLDSFEIIIGDDGSRPERAPQVASGNSRIRVVKSPPRTSYAARNAAANVARGEVLAFCDSDCQPEPAWLKEALAALSDADVVAGQVKFTVPRQPTVWTLLTIDLFLDQKQNVLCSRGVTANLVVRRQLFKDLGGFDESLPSGGDYEFVQRAVKSGARLRYAPRAVVDHPTIDTGGPFLRKIWTTNRWDGVRRARRRDRMNLFGALIMIPILGVVLARREALRPAYCLYRPRLEAAAVKPRLRDDLSALAALYFVVCYVAGAARTLGWMQGRRLARDGIGPVYGGDS